MAKARSDSSELLRKTTEEENQEEEVVMNCKQVLLLEVCKDVAAVLSELDIIYKRITKDGTQVLFRFTLE